MNERQIYHCESCDGEIRVIRPSTGTVANPKCRCGGRMKKSYRKPAVLKMGAQVEVLTVAKTNRI